LAFCYATGNAGTGMCLQGAVEYGYEFAPVAGIINLFARMPRPPYGFVKVSVADGQPVKATERQLTNKQNIHLRTAGVLRQTSRSLFHTKFSYHIFFHNYRQNL